MGGKSGNLSLAADELCVSCESRFSIAKLAHFATPAVPQTIQQQRVELYNLLQFDVSIAFDVVNPWANVGRMSGWMLRRAQTDRRRRAV